MVLLVSENPYGKLSDNINSSLIHSNISAKNEIMIEQLGYSRIGTGVRRLNQSHKGTKKKICPNFLETQYK